MKIRSKTSNFHWRTHTGDEIDLLILDQGKFKAFEFKFSSKPQMTKSLHRTLENLNPDSVTIIIPGKDQYPLHEKVKVCGLENFVRKSSD